MGVMASKFTSLTIVYSTVYSGADQRKIKAPRHWPLCGEFTGHRWIPRTNGLYAKMFPFDDVIVNILGRGGRVGWRYWGIQYRIRRLIVRSSKTSKVRNVTCSYRFWIRHAARQPCCRDIRQMWEQLDCFNTLFRAFKTLRALAIRRLVRHWIDRLVQCHSFNHLQRTYGSSNDFTYRQGPVIVVPPRWHAPSPDSWGTCLEHFYRCAQLKQKF